MSSMVSEYIIRPALQQVRRFSRSSVASEPETTVSSSGKSKDRPSSRDDAISETEEDSYLRDDEDDSASPPASSRSSVTPIFEPANTSSPVYERISRDALLIPPEAGASQRAGGSLRAGASQRASTSQRSGTSQRAGATLAQPIPISPAPELEAGGIGSPAAGPVAELSTSPLPADPFLPLPEDDGMGALRKQILNIQAENLPAPEQARRVHQLLMQSYKKSKAATELDRPISPSSAVGWEQKHAQGRLDSFKFWQDLMGEAPEKFVLTEDDIKPTFAPLKAGEEESEYRSLGCEHYKRNVKSQCSECSHCLAQKVGEACIGCGESAAMYYCSICKLWNNDPDRSIYHCPDCGICRVGRGLGKDFFHCKKCNACLNINLENSHRCIERLLDCDCPICGEYMFNTPRGICHMKCGHTLHKDCWEEHIKHAYKCPICNKSIVNMETQFRRLDVAIQTQPMPEKFQDTRAVISCNDCSARTTVVYHWLGLKCAVCQSYNTSQLQILGAEAETLEEAAAVAPDVQLPDSIGSSTADILQVTEGSGARDIPARRRRHSSNLLQLSNEMLVPGTGGIGSYVVQDRLARSVSPVAAMHQADAEDSDEDKGDMIGFWSRIPRSITSNEDREDDEGDSDDDSVSSFSDNGMDEDDEEEEEDDEINLFGHR
ncbi:hypothetical protein JX266_000008 [Neoarthrinium moseri]|nr:hypothetical protein JX266_000008 [Neoarthrinium moseri]